MIAYDPGGVSDGIPTVRLVLGLAGVTEEEPRVQVIPLAPPHAPAVVSPTAALSPFNQVTVTVPKEVPAVPAVNVRGEEVAEILKSGAGGVPQPLKLNDPIAVLHPLLEVAV
jgi:hypothetical protein